MILHPRVILIAGVAAALGAVAARAGLDVPPALPDMSGYATTQAVQSAISAMPAPGTATPPATALDGTPGTSTLYARADHTHAARVQRTVLTTLADGTATWTFARPIAVPTGRLPPIAYMVEDTGTPVVVQITGRTMTTDGTMDTHTAVAIRAQRARTLPAALTVLTALVGFDIFGGSASGVRVNVWAADPTQ
ncbi:hypothetical protein SAMN02799631_04338 [Methylobacterium sp. 174MFSha1.1]|uniref:hypothetical protein n=1 Tax=Methylobacterium sp. 174MFSha1.1 TaxID=1502749 RepID=UPI0008EB77D7|nr:hypothetical protein [Methylobacterium sp. 174MFSha1.1]SFV06022.1 hypothetical protein SAMN02799631_04338 [Methylobacterium sp. 174MFSha1.1]